MFQDFCREAETSQRSSSPLMGTLGGVYSLRFLCASAMQLVSFCVQKPICVLGNNAGSEERTYRHDLTRHILRQSPRVALCEKQLIYHDGYCKNQEVQSTGILFPFFMPICMQFPQIITHTTVPYFCSLHRQLLMWHSLTVVSVSADYWRES